MFNTCLLIYVKAPETTFKKKTVIGTFFSLNSRMLGPLTYEDYPDEMKRIVGSRLPVFTEEESALVKGSSDFVGVIHYLAASETSVTHVKSQSPAVLPRFILFLLNLLFFVLLLGRTVIGSYTSFHVTKF